MKMGFLLNLLATILAGAITQSLLQVKDYDPVASTVVGGVLVLILLYNILFYGMRM